MRDAQPRTAELTIRFPLRPFILLCLVFVTLAGAGARADVISGEVSVVSRRAGMFLVDTGRSIDPVAYGEETVFEGLKGDADLMEGRRVTVEADVSGEVPYALTVKVPPALRLVRARAVSVEEFSALAGRGVPFYDLRPLADYRAGHIPGALPLPDDMPEKVPFMFYCSAPDCSESVAALRLARIEGAVFFRGGVTEWKARNRPLAVTPAFIEEMRRLHRPVVLVDIRDSGETQGGFIPGAVSIPHGIVEHVSYRFPPSRSAPVVVYGSNGTDRRAVEAADVIRGWGFVNTKLLEGGFEAYAKEGYRVESGKMAESISYRKEYAGGALSPPTFRRYLDAHGGDTVILDVREREETGKGKFRGALNIPLDELQYRLDELPHGKLIITYCVSGKRARIGYVILQRAGFRAAYLDGRVGFEGPDVYFISEN